MLGTSRALALMMAVPVAFGMGCGGPSSDVPPAPERGVPRTLAESRAAAIRDLRYALEFAIPELPDQPITGRATVRFALADASGPLVFDFAPGGEHVQSVRADGRDVEFTAANEHIVLPAALAAGEHVVEIAFHAGDEALNRNPEFLYALFVPARARLTFPCFDQPDLKARFTLALDVPATWQAVSNGRETARRAENGRLQITFAETEPIPTYLFSFAAGRFSVETAERAGRTYRMFHRETDAQKVARNTDAVFDLHANALAWLERYAAIPYPFGKFDFVLIPSFQFSGMEHPGAIFYNASSILLDESATQNQMLGRASVIAHETAHMWFGDLVTMQWFDDVWMKEVFANFMAAKIVNPAFPDVNHELRFLTAHYPAAYAVDRTAGTHPIRQELANLSEAGSLYGAIIYQKAPIVMRQLERLIGEQQLQDGLRAYLRDFSFGNATWLDLVRILDERTSHDLAAWSRAWVEEAGRPSIRTRVDRDAEAPRVTIDQSDPQDGRNLVWTQQMDVLVGSDTRVAVVPVAFDDREETLPAGRLPSPFDFVLPAGGGLAYGAFELDPQSRAFLLARGHRLEDPVARGAAWITLWDEMLDGRVPPGALMEALLRGLSTEGTEQNVQLLAGYARQTYWRHLPEEARTALAPKLEGTLRDGWRRASSSSLKSTYFAAFRSIVITAPGVAFLERVWRRDERIPGLTLAEPDEASMALDLAVRSVPDAPAILEAQLARFQNPDRKARFAFVIPALSADPAARDAFFASLADVRNRRREPWVLEGLQYLHHPLRAAESAKYVQPSLEMLEEIRRTGDIFFPRDWMDATLSGHRSPAVAETVRGFLAERPDYPLRLRRVVLQAADNLFRATR